MESTDCPDKGYVFDNVMEKSETNYQSLGQFWSVISEVHVVYNYLKLDQSIDLNIFPEVQGIAHYVLLPEANGSYWAVLCTKERKFGSIDC